MPTLLLTNDDGIDSPMLPPLVRHLQALGDVRVAVPHTEQSWKGKAMTRYGTVRAEPYNGLGCPAYTVSGTPADAVNLGVHSLFAGPPDWVVAGVNIGINAGLTFAINSGTVGAALEGAVQGVPAVAFSMLVPPHIYRAWSTERRVPPEGEALAEAAAARSARMLRTILRRGLPAGAMMLNVNFPPGLDERTPVYWAPLLNDRYGSLFEPHEDGWHHHYRGNSRHEATGRTDRELVEGGAVAVTALTLAALTAEVEEFSFEE